MKSITVIFDVDGTLLDNRIFCEGMQRLWRSRYPQRVLAEDFFLRNNANTRRQTAQILDMDFDEYNVLVEENHHSIDPALFTTNDYPGVKDMLYALHAQGYTLGINTSRTRALLARGYQQHPQMFALFCPDYVVTADEVVHPKPAPDPLRWLCDERGLQPDHMLYIGDSIHDVRCARAAGVPFAWAAWGWNFVPDGIEDGDVLLRQPAEIFSLLARQEAEVTKCRC